MPMTDAQAEVIRLHEERGLSFAQIAKMQGKNAKTVWRLYQRAKRRRDEQENIDPAIRAGMEEIGTGIVPSVGWVKTHGPDKPPTYSYLLNPDKKTPEELAEIFREAFADIPAAPPIVKSEHSIEGKIAFFPQTDVHLGVEIDEDRGGTEYNPDIAMERMRDGFSQAHAAIPPCETAIVLDNGDLTHANDDRDVTPRHQHRLKVTNSHRKNLDLSVAAKVWQIDMALQRSERVIYRSNRGNHDPNTPDTMGIALINRYRDEPRVTIENSECDTWVFQRGSVFIAANHGAGLKPPQLAANLPPNYPDEFGRSRFWYLFTGHEHNPAQAMFGAFLWFRLPAMCALDQHAADLGYSDTAAMRAMMFCERGGLKHDMTIRF